MSFAREESEVFGARCVLELLDVGVVDTETELIELFLDVLDDLGWELATTTSRQVPLSYLLLEDLALFKDFLHRHRAHNDSSLAFDNAFDNVLDMTSLRRSNDSRT